MEMLESLKPKHIAVEGKIGNMKYVISDDYCVPPEQVPEILEKIARDAQRAFAAQRRAEIAADRKDINAE